MRSLGATWLVTPGQQLCCCPLTGILPLERPHHQDKMALRSHFLCSAVFVFVQEMVGDREAGGSGRRVKSPALCGLQSRSAGGPKTRRKEAACGWDGAGGERGADAARSVATTYVMDGNSSSAL